MCWLPTTPFLDCAKPLYLDGCLDVMNANCTARDLSFDNKDLDIALISTSVLILLVFRSE